MRRALACTMTRITNLFVIECVNECELALAFTLKLVTNPETYPNAGDVCVYYP